MFTGCGDILQLQSTQIQGLFLYSIAYLSITQGQDAKLICQFSWIMRMKGDLLIQ